MRKIAVGDLGEFWYGNYKEPFEQLEGAVTGYPRGALLKDDDGRILCAYCGKTFDYLPRHISHAHRMTTAAYKDEVGLLQKSALVSERIRDSRIATAYRNRAQAKWSNPTPTAVARSIAARRTNDRTNNPAERQNMTGRCHAQILTVAREIMRERGRVTQRDLNQRGIWQVVVEQRFGSLSALQRLIGDGRRNKGNQWSDAELIAALRSLADKMGRTPAFSDLRRFGLPSTDAYYRHFGSYPEACRRAGLTAFEWVPRDSASEAAYLLAWATTGDTHKAGTACGTSDRTIRQTLTKYGIPKMPPGGGHHAMRQAARRQAAEVAARLEGVAKDVAA